MTASAALPRGTIRVPRTVGRKCSSVDTITSETNPKTFDHACAGRSAPQRSITGSHPAAASVPSDAPIAMFRSASE